LHSRKIFSPEEANELVPALTYEFTHIGRLRGLISEHLDALSEGGVMLDLERPLIGQPCPEPLRPTLFRLVQMVKEIQNSVTRMNNMGCLVKDIELGLIDFHSSVNGEAAFLCWQFGEPAVAWYHPLGEGFSARRPLSAEALPEVVYN